MQTISIMYLSSLCMCYILNYIICRIYGGVVIVLNCTSVMLCCIIIIIYSYTCIEKYSKYMHVFNFFLRFRSLLSRALSSLVQNQ